MLPVCAAIILALKVKFQSQTTTSNVAQFLITSSVHHNTQAYPHQFS